MKLRDIVLMGALAVGGCMETSQEPWEIQSSYIQDPHSTHRNYSYHYYDNEGKCHSNWDMNELAEKMNAQRESIVRKDNEQLLKKNLAIPAFKLYYDLKNGERNEGTLQRSKVMGMPYEKLREIEIKAIEKKNPKYIEAYNSFKKECFCI